MLNSVFVLVLIVSVLSGLWGFVVKRKHFLNMLLSLEFIVLNMFFLVLLVFGPFSFLFFSMYFLVLTVCEGALGLSLLVCLIRTHSNDFMALFTLK